MKFIFKMGNSEDIEEKLIIYRKNILKKIEMQAHSLSNYIEKHRDIKSNANHAFIHSFKFCLPNCSYKLIICTVRGMLTRASILTLVLFMKFFKQVINNFKMNLTIKWYCNSHYNRNNSHPYILEGSKNIVNNFN